MTREEFEALVEKTSHHWLWHGPAGRLSVDGIRARACHVSYVLHRGPVERYRYLSRMCKEPRCVNPDHMGLYTQSYAREARDVPPAPPPVFRFVSRLPEKWRSVG